MPLERGAAASCRRRASSRARRPEHASSIHARSSPPAKTRSSGASIIRSHAKYDVAANEIATTTAASAMRAIARGRRNVAARRPTTKIASARRPDAGPGPASSASIRTQSAPGTVSIPASFASCAKGRISGSTSAATTPIARRRRAARQAGREPDDEADEPQRDEVEGVAVVEAVVAPGVLVNAATTRSPVAFAETNNATNAAARRDPARPAASELPEHDGRDRDGHDHEVDGEVAEVVDDPLPDLERVVPAPELPVRAERVPRRRARDQPRDEREPAEHDGSAVGQKPTGRPRPRPRRRRDQPEERDRADPGDVEDPELGPREERRGDRGEDGELAEDRRPLQGQRDRVERPGGRRGTRGSRS